MEQTAPRAFQMPRAIFATTSPALTTAWITTFMPPVNTPNPVCATPVVLAIQLQRAIMPATRAITPTTTQVTGEASRAALKPYCAAVAANVALVSVSVAAAWA